MDLVVGCAHRAGSRPCRGNLRKRGVDDVGGGEAALEQVGLEAIGQQALRIEAALSDAGEHDAAMAVVVAM